MTEPAPAPDGGTPTESPFAALGLPDTWAPVPIRWHLGTLSIMGPDGPATLHALMVDGPTGRAAYAFSPDDLRALADTLTEKCTGLTVARGPLATNGHHVRT